MYDLPGAYIRDLVELVRRWDVEPAALLAGLPMSPQSLADPMTRVPLRVCEAIFLRAYELTHERALAFHFGTQMRLSSHGFLGFAAMTAGTLREAVELATRFVTTRTSAIGLALYVEGDTASIVIEERTSLGVMQELIVIALLVGLGQIGDALTGHKLDGFGECAFPEPGYMKPLNDGRLRFGCPAHRLVFPAAELALPLQAADPVATRLAIEQCERELAAVVGAGLPSRARAMMAAHPERLPTLEELARALHMSPRTLKRKLAARDTTFSQIRDDLLRQRALLLLDNRTLSVGEVAHRLGYTELPNFTRAFRKWTGMTPIAYRSRGSS